MKTLDSLRHRIRPAQSSRLPLFSFALPHFVSIVTPARAHGLWTYEPRQGRNAATVVCSASAVVTLVFFPPSRQFHCPSTRKYRPDDRNGIVICIGIKAAPAAAFVSTVHSP